MESTRNNTRRCGACHDRGWYRATGWQRTPRYTSDNGYLERLADDWHTYAILSECGACRALVP
jgi:hypothetical protein